MGRESEYSKAREDLMKANQRIVQLESDNGFLKRQQEDEVDRLEREVRRYHSEVSDLVMENRRLKSLYGSAMSGMALSEMPRGSAEAEYSLPAARAVRRSPPRAAAPEAPQNNQTSAPAQRRAPPAAGASLGQAVGYSASYAEDRQGVSGTGQEPSQGNTSL